MASSQSRTSPASIKNVQRSLSLNWLSNFANHQAIPKDMTIANLSKDGQASMSPRDRDGMSSNLSNASRTTTPPATPPAATNSDGEKKYNCEYCDYTSSWPSHLRLHRMRHTGEKPYACNECNFQTAWVGDLKRHQRVHTGERPYSCSYCDFSTAQKGNLNTHMRRYHSNQQLNNTIAAGILSSLSPEAVDSQHLFLPALTALAHPVLSPGNSQSPPTAKGKHT